MNKKQLVVEDGWHQNKYIWYIDDNFKLHFCEILDIWKDVYGGTKLTHYRIRFKNGDEITRPVHKSNYDDGFFDTKDEAMACVTIGEKIRNDEPIDFCVTNIKWVFDSPKGTWKSRLSEQLADGDKERMCADLPTEYNINFHPLPPNISWKQKARYNIVDVFGDFKHKKNFIWLFKYLIRDRLHQYNGFYAVKFDFYLKGTNYGGHYA